MTGTLAEAPAGAPSETEALLEVEDLTCHIDTPRGPVRAVDGVSFRLHAGESLGVVGESGSGKSMTAMSILRLFGPRTRARLGGRVRFEGTDLLDAPERELRRLRGGRIGMVFQDPLTSLDPIMPVADQIAVPLRVHAGMKRAAARARAVELLDLVGIPDPQRRAGDLPHQFSGGMRQRILIAAAVACEPRLLIADEATTALDVTVQAQVLALLARLRRELDMALVVISHDLGVVSAVADTMQVMYAGRIVEQGPVTDLLAGGGHPYTRGLVRLVPHIDRTHHEHRLRPIPGQPPVLHEAPAGCAFQPRCELAEDRCAHEAPPLAPFAPGRARACWAPVPAAAGPPPSADPPVSAVSVRAGSAPPAGPAEPDMTAPDPARSPATAGPAAPEPSEPEPAAPVEPAPTGSVPPAGPAGAAVTAPAGAGADSGTGDEGGGPA